MAMEMAIGEEPTKFTQSWVLVPSTSQTLAMVAATMMMAGISGTKMEMKNEGRLSSATSSSAVRISGVL